MDTMTEPTLPILEVEPGWSIDDLETLEDCEDAHLAISEQISDIDWRLREMHEFFLARHKHHRDHAKTAKQLRMRKVALVHVDKKKADLHRAMKREAADTRDRRLINMIRDMEPDAFYRVLSVFQKDC